MNNSIPPPRFLAGDEPPLPDGWEWLTSTVHRGHGQVLVADRDAISGPRWVPVYLTGYESPNGSFELKIEVSCGDRHQLTHAIAGALWGLDSFVPETSRRKDFLRERCWSWLKLGVRGFVRWLRASWRK